MASRLEMAVRRTRRRTREVLGTTRLLTAVATGRSTELWIGDSHSVLLNTGQFPLGMEAVDDGRFIWHLGPRIMHSVASHGFGPFVERTARSLGRVRAARRLTVFFVFGEIDVRCHLAPRVAAGADGAWVAAYVERAVALADTIGARWIVFATPTPPSDAIADHVMFPISGDITERTTAYRWLCTALAAALPSDDPRVHLLDLRESLADDDGRLPSELTYDGCHTNDAGRRRVRAQVRAFQTTTTNHAQEA